MPHLTRSQRDQLQALRSAHRRQREIARILGCAQSTVSPELRRNSTGPTRWYTAHIAHARAVQRRAQALRLRPQWREDLALFARVHADLANGRSPDQIAGRVRQEGGMRTVSHETIYRYVAADAAAGGDLWTFLRYQGMRHKWRGYGGTARTIPNRHDISERPPEVAAKTTAGHWESDLVVSPRTGVGAVATFAERRPLAFRAVRVDRSTAEEMVRATRRALGDFPPTLRRTMTHDNGSEISRHEDITSSLGTVVYCARPYRASDRGLNEWYNREFRRFFPRGTDFSRVTEGELDAAVAWLNHCPRRSLGYRTPAEAWAEEEYAFRG